MFHSDEAYYCIILGARKGKHALEKASMQSAIIIKVNSELWASLIVELVKNGLAMQKNRVRFLGWEDPLEKGMVTHSSILAWRIPWAEEPGRLQPMGLQESDAT